MADTGTTGRYRDDRQIQGRMADTGTSGKCTSMRRKDV
jgi:hypothetical protein